MCVCEFVQEVLVCVCPGKVCLSINNFKADFLLKYGNLSLLGMENNLINPKALEAVSNPSSKFPSFIPLPSNK